MRKLGKVKDFIVGLAMIAFALALLIWPENAVAVIMLISGAALLVEGIYALVFYCTMAYHMVGGKRILYRSILLLDLAAFMLASYSGSEGLILLYLLALLAAAGAIDLVRALEFRKAGAAWKLRACIGLACIVMLITGLIYWSDSRTVVYIFCIGMFVAAISRLVSVFKKTTVIYIPE